MNHLSGTKRRLEFLSEKEIKEKADDERSKKRIDAERAKKTAQATAGLVRKARLAAAAEKHTKTLALRTRQKTKDFSSLLSSIYYDPKTGYTNVNDLYRKGRAKDDELTIKAVKEWYANQDVSQRSKRVAKPEPRSFFPITAGGEGSFQADLTFYDQYKKKNGGFNSILVFINIHTRQIFVEALKGKATDSDSIDVSGTVLHATEKIVERIRETGKLRNLTTDAGSEFTSSAFTALMRKHKVAHSVVSPGNKGSTGKVERVNRTLRGRIEKWVTANNNTKWSSVLQELADGYNNTVNRGIGTTPNKASGSVVRKDEETRTKQAQKIATKFHVGDTVLLQKPAKKLGRNTTTYFPEKYTVKRVNTFSYAIELDGEEYKRNVQWHELQLVDRSDSSPTKKKGEDQREAAERGAREERRQAKTGVEKNDGGPRRSARVVEATGTERDKRAVRRG
jgi:transposase InsO family protein